MTTSALLEFFYGNKISQPIKVHWLNEIKASSQLNIQLWQ
jgi:hypothetical protein